MLLGLGPPNAHGGALFSSNPLHGGRAGSEQKCLSLSLSLFLSFSLSISLSLCTGAVVNGAYMAAVWEVITVSRSGLPKGVWEKLCSIGVAGTRGASFPATPLLRHVCIPTEAVIEQELERVLFHSSSCPC